MSGHYARQTGRRSPLTAGTHAGVSELVERVSGAWYRPSARKRMEGQMGFAKASLDEFEVSSQEILHKPTRLRFWMFPQLEEIPGTWVRGKLMPNGEPYKKEDIREMAAEVLRLSME